MAAAACDEGNTPLGNAGIQHAGTTLCMAAQGVTVPSPIVVNNCAENCVGSVPTCAAIPVSCP